MPWIRELNDALAAYANIAAVIGALFSTASLVAVLFVRRAVNSAVTKQTKLMTTLRASSECRQLLVHLSGIRTLALSSDWNGVMLRSVDARRSATELALLTEGMGSQAGIVAGTITQLATLERQATRAITKNVIPDAERVVRIISKQEDTVQTVSSFLERMLRET